MFVASRDIIFFAARAREIVEALSNTYHYGGLWGSGLTGYCGIASRFLIELAKYNGFKDIELICGTFNNHSHCWVKYKGFCIDLTISQFKGFANKKYKICNINGEFYKKYYKADLTGKDAVMFQSLWDDQAYERYTRFLWLLYSKLY